MDTVKPNCTQKTTGYEMDHTPLNTVRSENRKHAKREPPETFFSWTIKTTKGKKVINTKHVLIMSSTYPLIGLPYPFVPPFHFLSDGARRPQETVWGLKASPQEVCEHGWE